MIYYRCLSLDGLNYVILFLCQIEKLYEIRKIYMKLYSVYAQGRIESSESCPNDELKRSHLHMYNLYIYNRAICICNYFTLYRFDVDIIINVCPLMDLIMFIFM